MAGGRRLAETCWLVRPAVATGGRAARTATAAVCKVSQKRRDLPQWEDIIDGPGRNGGARHGEFLRGLLVLSDHGTACRLHQLGPGRAVGVGSGEDDRHGPFPTA